MGRGTGMGIDTGGPAWSCVPRDVPGDASLSSACGRGGRDESTSGPFHLLQKSGRQRVPAGKISRAVSREQAPVLQSEERGGGSEVRTFSFKLKKRFLPVKPQEPRPPRGSWAPHRKTLCFVKLVELSTSYNRESKLKNENRKMAFPHREWKTDGVYTTHGNRNMPALSLIQLH